MIVYAIIFCIAYLLGFLTWILIRKKNDLSNEIGGYLHIITQEEESPYIFLELENEEFLKGKTTITLKIKKSAEKT